jgi:acetyl-CoA carboxylase biotin carboxyl carrier protein
MDIEHIRSLVELMVANDLSRVEIREGETHILLRRGQPFVALGDSAAPPAASLIVPPSPANPAGAAHAAQGPTSPPAVAEGAAETFIRSPMVGTFYASPDPESPAFVKVGDSVGPESVVCLVEAMKVFNEIKAERSGRISRILVKNAQAVEYDQPLFALTPT